MKLKKRRISSRSRTKKKDQSPKNVIICLSSTLKTLSVIILLAGATANDSGKIYVILLKIKKCSVHTNYQTSFD